MTDGVEIRTRRAPLVAIVTPVYNGARYLRETMDCVQAQTWPNAVHYVVNNASTDGTADILADYANSRIPVIVAQNETLLPFGDNWNRAITTAPSEAKYLRILCADDKMAPDAIRLMAELGERHPSVGVICTGFTVMDQPQHSAWPKSKEFFTGMEAVRACISGEGEIIGPHTMIRRDVLAMRTPIYDTSYNGIDTELVFLALQKWDFGFVHERLSWTRVHEHSISHTVMHRWHKHFADWWRLLHAYGQPAYAEQELKAHVTAYRRYYLRRLAHWRRERGGAEVCAMHLETMEATGRPISPLDWADAMADVALKKLKLRTPLRGGYPLG